MWFWQRNDSLIVLKVQQNIYHPSYLNSINDFDFKYVVVSHCCSSGNFEVSLESELSSSSLSQLLSAALPPYTISYSSSCTPSIYSSDKEFTVSLSILDDEAGVSFTFFWLSSRSFKNRHHFILIFLCKLHHFLLIITVPYNQFHIGCLFHIYLLFWYFHCT